MRISVLALRLTLNLTIASLSGVTDLYFYPYHQLFIFYIFFVHVSAKGYRALKNLEKAGIQYLKKLFSQKQQKVSLLTDFEQMNPSSGRNVKVVSERGTGFHSQVSACSKHKH